MGAQRRNYRLSTKQNSGLTSYALNWGSSLSRPRKAREPYGRVNPHENSVQ